MAYLKHSENVPTKGKGSKLSSKMSVFVDEYMVDMNAAQACVRAGYKTTNANKLGTELLQHPLVRASIEERMAARREKMELTAEYVLTKLVNIAEQTEQGNPTAALRALELLGKHLGLYRDRTEISGPDGSAIQMEQQLKNDVSDFTSRLSRLAAAAGAGGVSKFPHPGSETET